VKPVKVNRVILVKYTCVSGEYEFSGHTILTLLPRQKAETHVHEYFKDFYGEGNLEKKDTRKLDWYLYNGGEVAVKHVSFQEITQEQYDVLIKLGLCYA
jgi:hypothetical protein